MKRQKRPHLQKQAGATPGGKKSSVRLKKYSWWGRESGIEIHPVAEDQICDQLTFKEYEDIQGCEGL